MNMCEDQSKRGERRLQERSKTRGNVLLTPEHQTIVETKRKNSADRQQDPIRARAWNLNMTQPNDRKEDGARDYKSNTRKSEWRQISETQLDEQPGRSPDATEYQPNETRFHCHQISSHKKAQTAQSK
jgi:hypothetical protein